MNYCIKYLEQFKQCIKWTFDNHYLNCILINIIIPKENYKYIICLKQMWHKNNVLISSGE